jgi:hypothetical protein
MSIQDYLFKKMLQSKMKGMPQEDQDKALAMLQQNPDLFKKIAEETQEKVKGGMDQMKAAMEVASKYKDELQKLKQ